jgi:hypothetical protein
MNPRDDRLLLTQEATDALFNWLEWRLVKPTIIGGGGWTGGFDVLVDTANYTGDHEPRWCAFERITHGVYPYKANIPKRGDLFSVHQHIGQWKRSEIIAVRMWLPIHDDFPPEIPGPRTHPEWAR